MSHPHFTKHDSGYTSVLLERAKYPLDAVYGAANALTARCFVLLDAPDEEHIEVLLRERRENGVDDGLQALERQFEQELCAQIWRYQTSEHNRGILGDLTERAMKGGLGPDGGESLDELLGADTPEDDPVGDDDPFDDPLGISVPWEEKAEAGEAGEDAGDGTTPKHGGGSD